jgi:hypothetical protein
MGEVLILGVISRDEDEPRLAYLDELALATPETLELAAPLDPSQVFRLSARCEEKKCTHFDGRDCRWFRQEGRAACVRCPQIVTGVYDADATLQQVAGIPKPS